MSLALIPLRYVRRCRQATTVCAGSCGRNAEQSDGQTAAFAESKAHSFHRRCLLQQEAERSGHVVTTKPRLSQQPLLQAPDTQLGQNGWHKAGRWSMEPPQRARRWLAAGGFRSPSPHKLLCCVSHTYFPKVPSPRVFPISYFPTFFTMVSDATQSALGVCLAQRADSRRRRGRINPKPVMF